MKEERKNERKVKEDEKVGMIKKITRLTYRLAARRQTLPSVEFKLDKGSEMQQVGLISGWFRTAFRAT